jgi:predicted transcriptional regulator
MVVQNNTMEEGVPSVPSSLFQPSVCKRSRETPARAHPQAEEEVFEASNYEETVESAEDGPADSSSESSLQSNIECVEVAPKDQAELPVTGHPIVDPLIGKLTDRQREILANILDEPVSFDQLVQIIGSAAFELSAALTCLEINGLILRIAGDRYVRTNSQPQRQSAAIQRCDSKLQNESETVANDICSFLGLYFHGISRKYLQPYVAAYWCHRDRTSWSRDALKEACFRSPQISYEQILDYVTPQAVKLFRLTFNL